MPGEIQSILVPRKSWKRESFEKWLRAKKYKSKIAEEGDFFVAEQRDAGDFERIAAKRAGKGIVLRLGFKGEAPAQSATEKGEPWYDVPIDRLVGRIFSGGK